MGDIDNDGDLDVLIMNMGETPSLLLNQLSNKKHWVQVQLVGTRANKLAIGALVQIKTPSGKQVRTVQSQSSFLSQSSLKLHFGLGTNAVIEKFIVQWLGGAVEEFAGGPGDREYVLVEGEGMRGKH